MINGEKFFDQPAKDNIVTYENIEKMLLVNSLFVRLSIL